MKKNFIRFANESDILSILDLQLEYNIQNTSIEDREKYGFVTLLTPPSFLQKLIQKKLVVVCEQKQGIFEGFTSFFSPPIPTQELLGYAFLIDLKQSETLEFLKPLIVEIKLMRNLFIDNKDNCFILGQILVRRDFSGQGIAEKMISSLEDLSEVSFIVTEVSTANPRSVKFHFKQGFILQKEYPCAGQDFLIISKKT